MAQCVIINQTWESQRFHCPACGAGVFDDWGDPTDRPCDHLLFSWIDQVGEFINASSGMADILDHDDMFSPTDDDFIEQCPENTVMFAFRSCGMACGPFSVTVVHGIRFSDNLWEEVWDEEAESV